MSDIRILPTARPLAAEPAVPVMSLDGVSAAAMLVVALAPTSFVLAAALQMFGVHAF